MTGSPTATAAPERAPSVLVILVVRDAADWLRETLAALAAQTYPRLAVLAVDNASTDGSADLLRDALGERRVIVLPKPHGLAGSVRAALELPVASEADFVLLLHDDAAMDPDAVARLVEAAVGIGVERVGVVGPKVVDWEHPRELRDVGRSADLFGHPYAPLQPGEIDQGQFDRVLEVLCVSSASMLVSRDAWKRAGLFDERLDAEQQGLDFCWRARVTGYRVLMTPLARVRHRGATAAGERSGKERHRSARYREDRAAIASLLKNYGLLSLVWIVPLALIMGVVRLLFLLLARRFEEALDLLAAWGWNIAHFPGTWSRRRRVQKARRVKDRQLRRFMESAGMRWPRWFQTAEKILEEQRQIEAEDQGKPVTRRLRDRTASLVGTHPVIVASMLGVAIGAVAIRSFFGPEVLAGGALRSFPSSPAGFVGELVSAYRTTAIGGSLPASPALGALGGMSWLSFGSVSLAQKLVLAGAPVLGAVLLYRAASRLTGKPGPSVVAATAYLLSGVMLWSFSEGRLDLLVALAVLPAAFERVEAAFGRTEPADGRWRFVAGVGVTLAVLVAFYPGAALAVAVLVVIELAFGAARGRGLVLMVLAAVAASILLFPFVPGLVAGAGASFTSFIGTTDLWASVRLTPGGGPGAWEISAFLPIAALVSFALVGADLRPFAIRAAMAAVAGLSLAWLAAAGWLPATLSNPSAYLGLAAVAESLLVAFGLASVSTGLGREAFGLRQVGTAVLVVVLGGGIALQSVAAMVGGWAIGGPEQIPAAWAVVDSAAKGDFRVLWIGDDDGQRFPAPGGDAEGVLDAGPATLLYSVTDRVGTSALDIGRPTVGPGIDRLREGLDEILSGTTDHGGALLASFGIRFLVADADHLPEAASEMLDAQVDLNLVPAAGLLIYRNASALPPAGIIEADEQVLRTIRSPDLVATAALGNVKSSPLDQVQGGWSGGQGSGPVFLSTEYQDAWQLEGSDAEPERVAGWATAFGPTQGPVSVRYDAQLPATIQVILLALVWIAALWITRKPVAT
ncbi:MAG TPA: glycosyltransferase family 2 protein [Actinomycetota bacterium]